QPSKVAGIDFARISNPKPGEWLTYNGKLSGNRYSELTQINKTNVHDLTLKWIFSVPLWKNSLPDTNYFVENMRYFGLETTPVVADGIMYVTGPNRSEEHTSELQSRSDLVCRLLLEKKKIIKQSMHLLLAD